MGTRVVSWTKDTTGLSNALWTGVDHAQTNYPYDSVYLGFDEEVPFSSLGVEDFTLTRDGQEVALDSRLVCGILPKALLSTSATQEWKLVGLKNFASQDGEYVLTVDLSCVSDLSCNVGAGKFSVSWIVDASLQSVVVDENAAQDLEQNYVVTLSIVELDGYGAHEVYEIAYVATPAKASPDKTTSTSVDAFERNVESNLIARESYDVKEDAFDVDYSGAYALALPLAVPLDAQLNAKKDFFKTLGEFDGEEEED